MEVVSVAIGKIRPYDKNPRKNDAAVDKVAESIKQFGFQQPIVVDADGVIIAGHTRHKAAKKLGLKTVPVVYAVDLSPEQVKAYRLADNKTSEFSAWDDSLLADELAGILDIDMAGFGFDLSVLDDLETDVGPPQHRELVPYEKYHVLISCDMCDVGRTLDAIKGVYGIDSVEVESVGN